MTELLDRDPWYGANPLDPDFRDDPYPALRRLPERQPVHRAPFGLWRLSPYCQIADGPDEVHLSQLGKLTMRGR